jgi:hypothetical protein
VSVIWRRTTLRSREIGSGDELPALDAAGADCTRRSCRAATHRADPASSGSTASGTPAAGGDGAAQAVDPCRRAGSCEVREGEKLLILSTGRAAHVPLDHDQLAALGCDEPDFCPSFDFAQGPALLPAPLTVEPVDDTLTCVDDPTLVGTGDCSNSLFGQWSACGGGCEVWDYAELRVGLTVPQHTYGLAFDFAFMSVEWPLFVGGGCATCSWPGSIRSDRQPFDEFGNPVSPWRPGSPTDNDLTALRWRATPLTAG